MANKKDKSKTLQRVLQLQEKRRAIMELPAEKALDRILDDPQPAALVHSFPEQDFYLLVNESDLKMLCRCLRWQPISSGSTWSI